MVPFLTKAIKSHEIHMKSPLNPIKPPFSYGFPIKPGFPAEAKYLVNYGTRALAQFASVERLLTLSQLQAEEARGERSIGGVAGNIRIYILCIYL